MSYFTVVHVKQDIFIGGTDTTAIAVEWTMAELVRNPKKLLNTKEEIDRVIGSGTPVQESDIDRLPYLHAAVKEAMRLHPPVPLLLPYKSKADVEVKGGYFVPEGVQLLVNAWAIGRDPDHWKEPLSFIPERFLESGVEYKGGNFEYIPFGAGRRICPGWPLAARMVHLMVAALLQSFEWELPEGMKPEDLDMREQFGFTMKKAVPLQIVPKLVEVKAA